MREKKARENESKRVRRRLGEGKIKRYQELEYKRGREFTRE